jgi:hypothetical protein
MVIASATQTLLVKTAAGLPARFSFGATGLDRIPRHAVPRHRRFSP